MSISSIESDDCVTETAEVANGSEVIENDKLTFYFKNRGKYADKYTLNGTVLKGTTGGNLKNADRELVFYATSEIGNIPLKDG